MNSPKFEAHVMLITGADWNGSEVSRWRVENSWGEDAGNNGYYTMNDNWFEPNVFEIVVAPECLSENAKAALELDPIVLPPWDPMCNFSKRK